MNVLFICTGNTCRSPMAEAYLKSKELPDVTVFSRGLSVADRTPAKNAVAVMQEIGIDHSAHIASPLTAEDLARADLVYCLSASHANALWGLTDDPQKIRLLGNGIADPYGGDESIYRACRDEIISAIDDLIVNGTFESLTVRPADESDLSGIAALENECFSEPWSENALCESMRAKTQFLVAVQDEQIIGYLGVSIIAGEGYITNVAVTEPARRRGVASKLLERLMALCRDEHAGFVSLEVRVSNLPAITLYRKYGFEVVGERRNFYCKPTENAIIMTKRF